MAEHPHGDHSSGRGGRGGWVFLGFVLIAGFFLLTEHRAHVFQFLPFLLILACPLLHMFHGHGGHGGHGRDERDEKAGGAASDSGARNADAASGPAKGAAAADKPAGSKRHGCH